MIFAHRGDSWFYPENTILSFKKAIKAGCEGIELDVHKTKDNKLVVIHDEKVNRTYFGDGYVKEYTLKELQALKNRNLFFYFHKEVYIPTLEEVLSLVKKSSIFLNIEIKNNKIDYKDIEKDVIMLIKKYNLKDKIILSSFNHKSMLKCKEICKSIKTGLLYSKSINNIISYAEKYKADALHPCFKIVNEKYIENAHKNKIMVNVYTVNNKSKAKELLMWNIDSIITNYPKRMKKLIELK